MFGARMHTTLCQRLVSIDTACCYVRHLFSVLKLANEEEALVDVVENGEIVTEETVSSKLKQRKGKNLTFP